MSPLVNAMNIPHETLSLHFGVETLLGVPPFIKTFKADSSDSGGFPLFIKIFKGDRGDFLLFKVTTPRGVSPSKHKLSGGP